MSLENSGPNDSNAPQGRPNRIGRKRPRALAALLIAIVALVDGPPAAGQPEVRYWRKPSLTPPAVVKRGAVETKTYFVEFTWEDQRGGRHPEKLEVGTETTTTVGAGSSSRYAGRETKKVEWEPARYFAEFVGGNDKPQRLLEACAERIARDPRFLWTVGPVVVRNDAGRNVLVVPEHWRDEHDAPVSGGLDPIEVPTGKTRQARPGRQPLLASRFVCRFETPGGRTGPFEFRFDPRREKSLDVVVEEAVLAPVVAVLGRATPERPFAYAWTLPARGVAVVRVRREAGDGAFALSVRDDARGARVAGSRRDADRQDAVLPARAGATLAVEVTATGDGSIDFVVELLHVRLDELVLDRSAAYLLEKGIEFVAVRLLGDDYDAERTSARMVEDLLAEGVFALLLPLLVEHVASRPGVDWTNLDEAACRALIATLPNAAGVPAEVARGALVDLVAKVRERLLRSDRLPPEIDLREPDDRPR